MNWWKISKLDSGRFVTPKLCYNGLRPLLGDRFFRTTAPFGLGYIKWEIVWRFPSHFVWRPPQSAQLPDCARVEQEWNPTTWSYTRVSDHLHVDRGWNSRLRAYIQSCLAVSVVSTRIWLSALATEEKEKESDGTRMGRKMEFEKNGTCK